MDNELDRRLTALERRVQALEDDNQQLRNRLDEQDAGRWRAHDTFQKQIDATKRAVDDARSEARR